MAEIKRKDIFAKNVFTDPAKEAKALEDALNLVEKSLKDIAKISADAVKNFKVTDAKGIKKFNVALDKSKKAVSDLDKFEKKRLATIKKLEEANSSRGDVLAELQIQLKEQNQVNKEFVQLSNKKLGTLERLTLTNKKLLRERKKLNLDTKEGRDRLKAINLELDKNNKRIKDNSSNLEKQRLNVGNYSESIKEAAGASGLFGGVLSKLTAIQGVLSAFQKKATAQTEVQTVATTKLTIAQKASALATGGWSKALKVFKFALASTGIGLLVVALGSLISFFTRSQKGIDFLSVKMAGLGAAVDVIIDAFSSFGEVIFDVFSKPKKLIDKFVEVLKSLPQLILDNLINRFKAFGVIIQALIDGDLKALSDGFLQLGTGVENFTDKATEAFEATSKAAQDAIEKTKELAKELEEKTRIAQRLKELTIDLTREEALFSAQQATLITRTKELNLITRDKLKTDKERIDALEEINRIELFIANRQFELEEKALAASLDSLSANEKALKLDKERLKFIEDIKNGAVSTAEAIKLSEEFTLSSAEGEEAFKEIIEKIVSLEQARQNLLDKQATTIKRRSALEVQIATKNATAQQQLAAFQRELFKDEDEQIDKRIEAIERARDFDIEANRFRLNANIINETEFLARKLKLEKQTEEAIQKLRKKTKSNEDEESTKAEIEAAQKTKELIEEIALQEKALAGEQIDLEDERATNQKENLRKRIELAKEGSIEQLELQKELNDLLIEEDKKAAEEREKLRDEERQAAQDLANDVIGITLEELAKRDKARLKSFDDQISGQEELIAKLRENAVEGTEKALAFEEAQLEKQRLAKQREEERQAKRNEAIQLAQTFLNQVAEQSKENPDTAIAEAFKNTFLARAIARGLAGFFEGTDDTGSGDGMLSDKHGNITGYTHENEIVFSAKQKAALGHKSRDEIIDIVQDYDAGNTWAFMPRLQEVQRPSGLDLSEVVESNNRVVKAIENNAVHSEFDLTGFNYWIEKRIKGSQKEIIKHMTEKYRR